MSEWKQVELGKLFESISERFVPRNPEGVYFLNTSDVLEGKVSAVDITPFEGLPGQAKKAIQRHDILYSEIRPANKRYGLVDFEASNHVVSTKLMVLRKVTDDSLKYLLLSITNEQFLRELQLIAEGRSGSFPQITFDVFKKLEITLPPLVQQEAIAEVLSSLDDKIDLLKRQNKTLEGMAEALFRKWFIEEAQDDWDELPFGEVFDFTMGQSPPGSSFNEEGVGMPMYQGNADFGMRFPSARVYTTEPKRMAGPGDVLMSVRAPVGAMNMAKEKCCIGRGVAAFRFKEEPSFDTYTLYKIKAMISEFMVFNDQGTVFGSIGKGDLLQMVVTSPPFNLIEKFEAEVGPMDHKIRANANEIALLEQKRDTLLPKLMSGEVRVQMD